MILTTALTCMALNIYHEARGETFSGQHAVAQVTMNRAGRDPNKVCEIVTKSRQFSWTIDKLKRGKNRYVLTKRGEPKDKKAWALAQGIARVTLAGYVRDFTGGAAFYHARRVNPAWNKGMVLVGIYGNHQFYKFS